MRLGYYGKVPERGDFVRSNLPQSAINVWDDWLQQTLIAGKEKHPDEWTGLYQSSPPVRFSCSSGVMGADPWFGVFAASSDKVGRQFPFCVLGTHPSLTSPLQTLHRTDKMLGTLEVLILRAIQGHQSIDNISNVLALLASKFTADTIASSVTEPVDRDIYAAIAAPDNIVDFKDCTIALADAYMLQHYQQFSVFQICSPISPSEGMSPASNTSAVMMAAGLPTPAEASSLISGYFSKSHINIAQLSVLDNDSWNIATGSDFASDSDEQATTDAVGIPSELKENHNEPITHGNDDDWSELEAIEQAAAIGGSVDTLPLEEIEVENRPKMDMVRESGQTTANTEALQQKTPAEALEVETLDIDEEDLSTMPWES